MSRLKKALFGSALFSLIMIALAFAYINQGYLSTVGGTGQKSDTNYVKSQTVDTVLTASVSDTSFKFENPLVNINGSIVPKYKDLYVEYTFNGGVVQVFKIGAPYVHYLRFRYYSTDSSLYTQRYGNLGWEDIPIIPLQEVQRHRTRFKIHQKQEWDYSRYTVTGKIRSKKKEHI